MKFDPARAMETIEEIARIEAEAKSAEAEVASLVEARLKQFGWTVECREVVGSTSAEHVRRWLGRLGFGLVLTVVLVLARRDAPVSWRVLGWVLAYVCWGSLATPVAGRTWSIPPWKKARLLIARQHGSDAPGSRVVIQAALGPIRGSLQRTPDSWVRTYLFYLSGPLLLLAVSHVASSPLGQWPFAGEIGWVCIAGIWTVILIAAVRRLFRADLAPPTCDRPALAILLELARTWPRSRSERVETILVAVGGQEYDRAGDRALVQIMENEWSKKPTLVFALAAPAIGQGLTLISAVDLVREAAESLWMPHRFEPRIRFAPRGGIPEKVYPLLSNRGEQVVLIAGRWSDNPPPEPDPQAFTRVAQLVEEVALRWGRRHGEAERHDDRSAARSFQNPG